MTSPKQTYETHIRRDPPFHFFLIPVMLISVIWASVNFYGHPGWTSGWLIVVSLALLVLAFLSRVNAIRVQDRVIRLEELLRYQRVLTAELLQKSEALSKGQIIALRFAPDEELSSLVWQVAEGNLSKPVEIKKAIKNWRSDTLRV